MKQKSKKGESRHKDRPPRKSTEDLNLAQEAIWESEEKCRTIIQNIEDGYYEVDLAGNFTFFNDAMCRMTGYSRSELLGMNNRAIMDEYNAKRVFKVFNKTFLSGLATRALDWELTAKDGSKRFIEVSVTLKRDLNGEPIGFMGVARDITQRKMMEQALKDSEEKYRTIIENIEDGYYEVDLDGNFKFFNDAMTRITGFSRQELMGMNNRQIMDDYNAKRVYDVFLKVYQTGLATKAVDWELVRKDGSQRFIEVSVTLKKRLDGSPIGFMGIARDITNRKAYEKKLKQKEEELEIKNIHLEEVNTALKVILRQREQDKSEVEKAVTNNLHEVILPYLEKIRKRVPDKKLQDNLSILEQNLNSITTPFSRTLTSQYPNLTSSEIDVANFIKQGKTTKEIADLMSVSSKTIEFHRINIRKKFGISNQKTGLRTLLLSLE